MKKILVLASVFAAFGLVACGDDSGSSASSKSCLVADAGTNIYCVESSDMSTDDCTGTGEEAMGGTIVGSCPSGAAKSCEVSGTGGSGTMNVYDASMAAFMCP